jgi:glyoxylase-like metal-dependent hydrolase (beta-lactamase superfamily II)
MQAAEHAFAFEGKPTSFPATQPILKLNGDHDIFGDGSAVLISTPGHTPGHQSLMIKLPKTGFVLLTGDAVHLKDNWDNRRVPAMNFDKDKTVASMERLAALMAQYKAQLWMNHDKAQSDGIKRAPEFYD